MYHSEAELKKTRREKVITSLFFALKAFTLHYIHFHFDWIVFIWMDEWLVCWWVSMFSLLFFNIGYTVCIWFSMISSIFFFSSLRKWSEVRERERGRKSKIRWKKIRLQSNNNCIISGVIRFESWQSKNIRANIFSIHVDFLSELCILVVVLKSFMYR